ncbi:MAG TPA: hypothetical protein VM221_14185 [Armatimonadota bacterium]|nr:hypothetical protein [Armatimonadota bacterium]
MEVFQAGVSLMVKVVVLSACPAELESENRKGLILFSSPVVKSEIP